ncbi:MAG: YkgJ family cysteine cluster protein [Candidatus Helarchaeota archaeon]
MKNTPSFQCLRCGKCCNPNQVNGETAYFIPIYLNEVERIENLAKQKALKITLEPDIMYHDELNDRLIVVTYALRIDKGGCPFYKSKCIIYDQRPITCKAYPLSIYMYQDTTCVALKSECTFVQQNRLKLKNLDYYELNDVFCDEFPFSREIQIMGHAITDQILALEAEKKVRIPIKIPVEVTEEIKQMEKIRLDEIKRELENEL